MQAIPPHLGEIYLSWYYHEQNYHLDEYFLETFCYLAAESSTASLKISYIGQVLYSCNIVFVVIYKVAENQQLDQLFIVEIP